MFHNKTVLIGYFHVQTESLITKCFFRKFRKNYSVWSKSNLEFRLLVLLNKWSYFRFSYHFYKSILDPLTVNQFSNGFLHLTFWFFFILEIRVLKPYIPPSQFSKFCPPSNFLILVPISSWTLQTSENRYINVFKCSELVKWNRKQWRDWWFKKYFFEYFQS